MMMTLRRILVILIAALMLAAEADARQRKTAKAAQRQRSVESVRKEKDQVARDIRDADRRITDNRRRTEQQVDSLESIRRSTASLQADIRNISTQIDSTDARIARLNDSISACEAKIDRLRDTWRKAMRRMQGERSATSRIEFVFSAHTFTQAVQRVRYLRQFGVWQRIRTAELRHLTVHLDSARVGLRELRSIREADIKRLEQSRTNLAVRQRDGERMLATLQRNGDDLRAVLRKREQRARELDKELDKLIAAEQARIEREQRRQKEAEKTPGSKKPKPAPDKPATKPTPVASQAADRKLTGSFASNKGQLSYPVKGRHRIVRGFGRQKHPDMPHVTTDNSGIDIEVQGGTGACAVYDGRVASILQVPGYNYVVMVRHGEYLTVYSGLDKPVVTTGAEVKTGQRLASVMSDESRDGAGVLHFELRHNSQKLNPLQWIK